MKKFLFAILACTIALGFTACREKKAKDKVKDYVRVKYLIYWYNM